MKNTLALVLMVIGIFGFNNLYAHEVVSDECKKNATEKMDTLQKEYKRTKKLPVQVDQFFPDKNIVFRYLVKDQALNVRSSMKVVFQFDADGFCGNVLEFYQDGHFVQKVDN
jgi:methionine aminopeptidase